LDIKRMRKGSFHPKRESLNGGGKRGLHCAPDREGTSFSSSIEGGVLVTKKKAPEAIPLKKDFAIKWKRNSEKPDWNYDSGWRKKGGWHFH